MLYDLQIVRVWVGRVILRPLTESSEAWLSKMFLAEVDAFSLKISGLVKILENQAL